VSKELLDLLPIILISQFLWLGVLSFVFYKLLNHYKKLKGKGGDGDLISILEKILKAEEGNRSVLARHTKELKEHAQLAEGYVQKLGLVRFNPFSEIGGDQSFVVCLLDNKHTGFILTGLHTRDRTRIYVKPIREGESKIELSKEEKKALMEARSN